MVIIGWIMLLAGLAGDLLVVFAEGRTAAAVAFAGITIAGAILIHGGGHYDQDEDEEEQDEEWSGG
jgi:hypothetical protein